MTDESEVALLSVDGPFFRTMKMQALCKPSACYLVSVLGFPGIVGVAVTLLVIYDYVIWYLLLIRLVDGLNLSACHREFHFSRHLTF